MLKVGDTYSGQEVERESEIDIRSLLGLLRRQFRLILVTVVLVVAVAGGVTFTLEKVYSASALILVDPSRKDLYSPELQMQGASTDSARVDSEVELAKAEPTLTGVVERLGLVRHPAFEPKPGLWDTLRAIARLPPPPDPTGEELLKGVVDQLRDAIRVQRRGLTYLISVEARSTDPALAAVLANAVAEEYIEQQITAKRASVELQRGVVQGTIDQARAQVEQSEEAFDAFIDDHLADIVRATGRTDIADLSRELAQINDTRSRIASVSELAANSLTRRDWSSLTGQLESEALQQYETRRRELEAALAGAVAAPERAVDLQAELASIEAEMASVAQAELTSLRRQIAQSEARAADLRTQRSATVLQTSLPPSLLTQILGIQQSAEIARQQYQTLLTRLKDLDVQSVLQVADSRIASSAVPPNVPSFPNIRLTLALAGLAALGLGIGLAFLLENYIGGFTSEAQLQSVLRSNVIATLPLQRTKSGATETGVAALIANSPLSIFAEGVRRARLGIDQAARRTLGTGSGAGVVIMVTSAIPGEGKTTVALSLARAYALSGRSTLLVDCDLRKPGIHRQLGITPESGLLDYLSSGANPPPLQSVMTVDEESGAQIILGARRSDIPTDQLLAGDMFGRLIRAAQQNFEVTILDTSPIVPVVDGLYLAQYVDVVAMVVRWASTSQHEARSTMAALTEAKRPDVEIVTILNQQTINRASYRSKYAGYYSDGYAKKS